MITRLILIIAACFITGCASNSNPAPVHTIYVFNPVTEPSPAITVISQSCKTWETKPNNVDTIIHIKTNIKSSGPIIITSFDVAFLNGNAQVGSITQVNPESPGNGGSTFEMLTGAARITAIADNIYLSGNWSPNCQIEKIHWSKN